MQAFFTTTDSVSAVKIRYTRRYHLT